MSAKVVILAGGVGSRLADSTEVIPKPMLRIGEKPLLWHIMQHYATYGCEEFVVAAGYKSEVIKRYFLDYQIMSQDLRLSLGTGDVELMNPQSDCDWIVEIVETGLETETGGRLMRLQSCLDSTFMLTFGDGLSDVDIGALLEFHRSKGKIATVTAVHPPPRFGELRLDESEVTDFSEKPMQSGWINGGYMVFEPSVFEYLREDVPLYGPPMEELARDGQLSAYLHDGFWQGVDTIREKTILEELWNSGSAPWHRRRTS